MKRWICLFLAAALLCCVLPSARAAQRPDSWSAIEALEQAVLPEAACPEAETRAALYTRQLPQMVAAVLAAPDYVPGSLERHGSFFFWESTDGRANGYSPSLRARLQSPQTQRADSAALPALPLAEGESIPDNRDVGVFIPYSGSYYFYPERCIAEGQAVADSTGGTLRVCTGADTNVDSLAQLISQSGFLLINSHGVTDYELGSDHVSKANSSYICLPTDAGITAEDQKPVVGPYGSYRHAFYSGSSSDGTETYYCVDGTCIVNHMQTQAPHSMIWLGFCLGMATEGMYAPLQAQGVEAMIGFSEAVTVDADHAYRAALCTALLRDCTLAEAAAAMKEQVGLHDPYQTDHAPAYPIAVSSQDAYPGRTHLTEGQQLCSTWKLYPPYPINIVVEPADSADVHVTRTNLEISPHRGYRFADWALSGEGASGVRSDNRLELRLTGPCTVTLRMEARTPASLHFSTAPGQSAQDFQEFVGDSVELPAPEGTPEADAFVYHFIGWSREPIPGSSQERPELLAAGSRLTLTQPETVLYAVYGYFAPEDGCSAGQFRLLTEAPEDWAGDYVISYQSSRFLWGGSRFTGQAIASPSAAARLAVTGCFVDGEYLNEVPEDLVYSFLPTDDGSYLLKMTSGKHYLTVPGSSVLLSTTEDPGAVGAAWRLKWSNGAALITNAKYSSRYLQFSLTGSCFCTLTALRSSLSLYARVPGLHLYTTEPRSSQPKPELPCSDDAHCPGRIFTDLPARGHWAHDAIDWAALTGVSTGTGANRFSPQQRCTRAQIVTFLWRAAGAPAPAGAQCAFPDVQPGAYYEQAVQWAWEQGIAFGTEEGLFRPNDSCTREQAVSFLWRCAGSPAPQSGDCPFDDLKPESYARSAVLWAAEQGIAEGTGAACFRPAALCTRAQIAALLYRAVRLGLL